MHPLLTDPRTATLYDLGTYAFVNTVYATGSQSFRGSFNPTSVASKFGAAHFFDGQFTGPGAEELFARWQSSASDPVSTGTIDIFGVMVGKKN